jgi:uncharacterized 2Fe-2S/4Fe-4S cluster protein (DUF4445 family)
VAVNPAASLSPLSEAEAGALAPDQIAAGARLACQAKIIGPATVSIPREALDGRDAVGKTGLEGSYPVDPAVRRLHIPHFSAIGSAGKPVKDHLEKVASFAEALYGEPVRFNSPSTTSALSLPFSYGGDITLASHRFQGVTAVLKGNRPGSLGVALDIGTTTVAAYLCDLITGKIIASAAAANPQRRFGEDVISRITFANEDENGLAILQKLLVDEINLLIARCLEKAKGEKADVDEVAVVGNTTMEHIFSGLHPHGLGFSPYLPVESGPRNLPAGTLGLDLSPATNVHVFPVVSGFVGGDTIGVVLSERPDLREEISLIVDIGTNGEVVLGNREGLWVTSCATGPALEGAHIAHGMRAVPGAIHRVDIDPETCRVSYETLGDAAGGAKGLCGSGIIDAVAAMLRADLMLPTGRLREGAPGVVVDREGVGRKFILVSKEASADAREIAVTLPDIRQVQLAKAALSAGIRMLMRRAGIVKVDTMVLTGAFGARFDWRNAVAIGMLLSPGDFGNVRLVENAAGVGAIRALLDVGQREEASRIAGRIRFLELAEDPDFSVEFSNALYFPEEAA